MLLQLGHIQLVHLLPIYNKNCPLEALVSNRQGKLDHWSRGKRKNVYCNTNNYAMNGKLNKKIEKFLRKSIINPWIQSKLSKYISKKSCAYTHYSGALFIYDMNFIIWNERSMKLSSSTIFWLSYILFSTKLHLINVYYLFSACLNPTDVVLVIAWDSSFQG